MILSGLEVLTRQVISEWTSAVTIVFDKTKRQAAKPSRWLFDSTSHAITLHPGAYLVDFNETIQVGITAGVVDAGYEGALGTLIEVKYRHGVFLHRNAKLAQIVFEELGEAVERYNGIYQSSTSSVGRDGTGQRSNA
ncbi:hypothetical protein BJX96DRAFT_176920 [Aspergillus floccosus]